MAIPDIKESIRLHRGRLAILQQATIPYSEEICHIKTHHLTCEMGDFKPLLAPFSKRSGSEPVKTSSDIVFLELIDNALRFRQDKPYFIGDWLEFEEQKEDLWHPLPNVDNNTILYGEAFHSALNRMSSTGELGITLGIEKRGVYLQSEAGIEWITGKKPNIDDITMKLPRIQLQRVCGLTKNFTNFVVSVKDNHLIVLGEDTTMPKNQIKNLIYAV